MCCCGDGGVVVWLVGAGLKPAPTSGTLAWIDKIRCWRTRVARPRSLRSRPFRPTKGAWVVADGVLRGTGVLFVWLVWPSVRPGHPPLASLRSLAPPYAARKGCWWCLMACCGERVCCWFGGVAPVRPGHPPLACCARSRPLTLREGGVDVQDGQQGGGFSCTDRPKSRESHLSGLTRRLAALRRQSRRRARC